MSDELLYTHRAAIDQIDNDLVRLLNQRATLARKIGEIKGKGCAYRPEREAQVLRCVRSLNAGPLTDEAITLVFREIMSVCLALEKPLSVAYLGPEGTFSELAVAKHFGHAVVAVPYSSLDQAFHFVASGAQDYVVAPVENSVEGPVGRTLDLLVNSSLKICGEVSLRIRHHLLRKLPGLENLRAVYAHPQALAQCRVWLATHLPNVENLPVASNAAAAQFASDTPDCAAIAGQIAAERFNLCKVAENIEDYPHNTTRFLILGQQDSAPSGNDKTSLIVAAPNQPGAVYHLLAPLAEQGVTMTKFESRPSLAGLWDYLFFIDVLGHRTEQAVANALEGMAKRASFVKVLGSYPTGTL